MATVGNVGPLRPIWPQKPQDKLDPKNDRPRGKRIPSAEEGDPDDNEQNGDEGHIDDYA